MDGEAGGRQIPRLWAYLLICAGFALWIDLGTLHRLQHADSLLPVLVSLQRWTPFFWEQDRYGMLIPWLARPVTDPFGNLLLQGFLNVACGLSAFFLLARYVVRERSWPIVGGLGAASFLAMTPAKYRFDYLMDANYGVWLSLALGGLIVAEAESGSGNGTPNWGRRLVALSLLVLAHWVYVATALYLGTLVALRALFAPGIARGVVRRLRQVALTKKDLKEIAVEFARTETGRALLMLAAAFWTGLQLSGLARHHQTSYAMVATREWPHAWLAMVERSWWALAPGIWPLALGGAAVLVAIVSLVKGRQYWSSIPWREIAALMVTALVIMLFMGTRRWIQINTYAPRYLIPSVFLIQAALCMLIVVPVARAIDVAGRRAPKAAGPIAVVLLLFPGVVSGYGLPSPRRVRADLDRFGALTADVLGAHCTHIAGDYWTVWPAVFHANLTLHERGEPGIVWGVTFRGQPASVLWWDTPQSERCVCIPLHDVFGDNWLLAFGFGHFRDVERRPTIRVLRRRYNPDEGVENQGHSVRDAARDPLASLVETLPGVLPRKDEAVGRWAREAPIAVILVLEWIMRDDDDVPADDGDRPRQAEPGRSRDRRSGPPALGFVAGRARGACPGAG